MQAPKGPRVQLIYRCNEILWRCLPEYESVKTYGRRGQHQHGVDLTGICVGALELIVGVQCELRGRWQKNRREGSQGCVEKALTFTPLLSECIIVTTAKLGTIPGI